MYKSYSEFARNGEGRNGLALALNEYQRKLDLTLREIEELRAALAEKEKRLATAPPMAKDPPGSYWRWDDAEKRDSRTVYHSHSRASHPLQSLPWSETWMAQYRTKDGARRFAMQPVPEPGKDPYPGQGVVVQSVYGLLHVPATLLHRLVENAATESGPDNFLHEDEKFSTPHGRVGYLLQHMQQ